MNAYDFYQNQAKMTLYKYYSIKRMGDNVYILGDKEIQIDNNSNLIVHRLPFTAQSVALFIKSVFCKQGYLKFKNKRLNK